MAKPALQMLLLGLSLAQCAAATAGQNAASALRRHPVWRSEAVEALAARSDASSLATAAALRFAEVPAATAAPTALDLIGRASELAPQDAGIGWLHLQLCSATPTCDTRDVALVLRWVDPDNAAAWLSQLATAHKDKDTIEVDRVLADMARGPNFDLYFNQILVLMSDALDSVRRQMPGSVSGSEAARLSALAGVAAAEIIPSLGPLVDVCREAAQGSQRREDCLKLSKIMQKGDTIVVQLAGFGIEKRMLPADSKEAKALLERKRLLEWRSSAAGKLDYSLLPWTLNARARTRLAQMRLRPREEDVCIALLRGRKMALEPPEMHR